MSIKAENCYRVFSRVVADYHDYDDINRIQENPYPRNTVEHLLYKKTWIDSVQWHLEDMIRDPQINPEEALQIKRRIDAYNQHRTDTVEYIDDYFFNQYRHVLCMENARINTESLGWALDRLSILCLKEYHINIELARIDCSLSHRQNCQQRKNIINAQREDLLLSINGLVEDIEQGRIALKTYKQLKMYNDEAFNPVLYKKKSIAG
jgi:Protein of unknown function (DUF4254)